MMTIWDRALKRAFDIVASAAGLAVTAPVILVAMLVARLDTGASGLFRQKRVGRRGQLFRVNKIRTMKPVTGTSVTTRADPRITRSGAFFRRWKIDELPQLWNVFVGEMSLVGPRPDVPGFADRLCGEDYIVLTLRPGITGPATIRYRDEEELLAREDDPEAFNRDVIWPDKVRINREYVENYRFRDDLVYLWLTVAGR